MARALTQAISNQITDKAVGRTFTFKINGTDYSAYVKNWDLSFDTNFGSASASFTLNNNSSDFSEGGDKAIFIGDVVELIEYFQGDSTQFKKFYGTVEKRTITKRHNQRDIKLSCLDYIAILKNRNINLTVEGTKEKVENEELSPVYLPEPQEAMAQIFNFANNSVADQPAPLIKFQDRNHADFTDDQFDGFEIYHSVGQMKLGTPLNVLTNYKVLSTYYHYTRGLYIEDVIESIITQPDGYGNYLFGEATAQDVIDNHLTDTFQNIEGAVNDTLYPNLAPLSVTVEQQLTQDFEPFVTYETTLSADYKANEEDADSTVMHLTDSTGFELGSGETTATAQLGTTNKYSITYTGVSGNTLTGVTVLPLAKNFSSGLAITRVTDTAITDIYVASSDGFPTPSGDPIQIQINGDITSYSSITEISGGGAILGGIGEETGKTLKAKPTGSYVQYIKTYDPGTIWALRYNNIQTDLVDSDFIYPSGYAGELVYVDKRLGRIILSEAVSFYSVYNVYCTNDYSFKTLQATGIEITRKVFRERETSDSFAAIKELRKYLAPNYIIRTLGDDKIWASYLTQNSVADYNLELVTSLDYQEDQDLYTRVKLWTKNSNPTNVMFGDSVDYEVDDEDAYTGVATKEELMYLGEERSSMLSTIAQDYLTEAELFEGSDPTVDVINYLGKKYINKEYASQPNTGMRVYATPISNEYGKIILDTVTPLIWINGVPIDNQVHRIDQIPVKIYTKTATITESGGKSKSASTQTYYYYIAYFPHTSIVPEQRIEIFDVQGATIYTIEPNDPNMNYATGVYTFPGGAENDIAASVSTAGYHVLYDTNLVEIDYDDVVFKIDKSLIPNPDEQVVRATFEYWSIAIGIRDIQSVVDGRRDTQLQLQFFGEPMSGFHLATIDLGAEYNIQAIDMIAGFFKPDEYRKFDVAFTMSMKYSTNGVDFYAIGAKTEQFTMKGGEATTFEEEDLGIGFRARYLKFNLYDVARLDFAKGRYVVALTEISVYNDIILEAEATLIPASKTTVQVNAGDTVVYLNDASMFTEPESGETATAYFNKEDAFTYTGIESGSTLTGCTLESGTGYAVGTLVSQDIMGDTTVYDEDELLPHLGDRIAKENLVDDRNLYTQAQSNAVAKAFLQEYYKDHTKAKVEVLYSPHLMVGQTVSITDVYNNINNVLYFIESVSERSNGANSLVLARYPASTQYALT